MIPALIKEMGNEANRKAILESIDAHLEKVSERADFARLRGNLPGLQAALGQAIPALWEGLNLKNDDVTIRVYILLGRIVSFARLSRGSSLQKVITPASKLTSRGWSPATRTYSRKCSVASRPYRSTGL